MGDQEEALNENLGDFIDCLTNVKENETNGWKSWSEENWEEEFEKHPFFRKTPIEPGEELSPEMEAMMAMKWDIDDPDEKAEEYKKEGNEMFKLKKYRFAIISYTEGIKMKGKNRELTAILYSNRAASHYHLCNWRSALSDCVFARKFQPSHPKAIKRGIDCCFKLSRYADAMKWCDAALILDPKDEGVLKQRAHAVRSRKTQERDERKEALKKKKERSRKMALVAAVRARGVTFGDVADLGVNDMDLNDTDVVDGLDLSALESRHPSGGEVSVDSNGVMTWPVMFLYPEYAESDYIRSFKETDSFRAHLDVMFKPSDPPPWDTEGKYRRDTISLFFEDKIERKLVSVKPERTLLEALQIENHRIYGGTPTFIVLPSGPFLTEYFKHYERSS